MYVIFDDQKEVWCRENSEQSSIFKGCVLLVWKINVYSFLHLFSVRGYMYVPKCTHTIVHMWPEDNVQDTILVFHVGLQVVVCDVSFTLRAILLDLTRYSLKRQGEDEAELSTWLWMWLWFQSEDSAANKCFHWRIPLSTRQGWGLFCPHPHPRALTPNFSI